jgi:hypothetical protein
MGKGETLLNAGIGAVVTLVFSFAGFSPILGGAVAGYLQQESRTSGAKVGALSGVLSFIPFLLFGFLFFGIFLNGPMMGGEMGIPASPEFFILLSFLFPVFLLWNIGLGALGGYLGVVLREDLASSNGGQGSV